VKRKAFEVRPELKDFFDSEKTLSREAFGRLARKIIEEIFQSLRNGQSEESVRSKTLEEFSQLLSVYAFSEGRIFWQEFKRLYDAGVIKQAPLVQYLMDTRGITQQEAVKYIAETFGMKESTQAVYLSDEHGLRQKEKERSKSKG
jgi:hypothetical protein